MQGMPSDPVANSKGKEQCHVITLRSGKEVHNPAPVGPRTSELIEELVQNHHKSNLEKEKMY